MIRYLALLCLIPSLALASVEIKGSGTTNVAKVNASGSLQVNEGASQRVTYIASAGGLATTALFNMSIESGAALGYKISQICVGVSNATAAALVTVTVQRRTTASSGGTAMTNDGTASPTISRMDQADGTWPGTGRVTATLGTAGAILDQWGFTVGEIGAGAADTHSLPVFCRQYGLNGEKLPTAPSGATNGISVNVSAPGAGGLAAGSISMTLIAE